MYSQVLLVVLVCIAGSYGYSFGRYRSTRNALCTARKPCRLRVITHEVSGDSGGLETPDFCSCGYYRGACSTDWTDSQKTITRNLISNQNNMTLVMMFCEHIAPPHLCRLGDKALVLSGSLIMPLNLESYDCRCEDGAPLLLNETQRGNSFLSPESKQTFVCDYHMATCPSRNSPCLVSSRESTTYNCKCPRGEYCQAENNFHGEVAYGYCRRTQTSHTRLS